MGMQCLDIEDCGFENSDKAHFCARCGIALRGALVQGRYEIQALTNKDRTTVTLSALDRHTGRPVTIRALRPRMASELDREAFLQDAELAMNMSKQMRDPGNIYVTDFGQDGPLTFLVKSEYLPNEVLPDIRPFKSRMTIRIDGNLVSHTPLPAVHDDDDDTFDDEDDALTML